MKQFYLWIAAQVLAILVVLNISPLPKSILMYSFIAPGVINFACAFMLFESARKQKIAGQFPFIWSWTFMILGGLPVLDLPANVLRVYCGFFMASLIAFAVHAGLIEQALASATRQQFADSTNPANEGTTPQSERLVG